MEQAEALQVSNLRPLGVERNLAVLKVSQVASQLNVGHQTVLDWITRGIRNPSGGYKQLHAVRTGRSWRITEKALDEFLSSSDEIEPTKNASLSRRMQKKIQAEVKEY
jgi:hypothetical protein